jgi:ABC-type proline/glycine betaine transport system ATPase subunit
VTHDATEARQLASEVLVLEHGKVSQFGRWEELMRAPATSFVRDFTMNRAAVA